MKRKQKKQQEINIYDYFNANNMSKALSHGLWAYTGYREEKLIDVVSAIVKDVTNIFALTAKYLLVSKVKNAKEIQENIAEQIRRNIIFSVSDLLAIYGFFNGNPEYVLDDAAVGIFFRIVEKISTEYSIEDLEDAYDSYTYKENSKKMKWDELEELERYVFFIKYFLEIDNVETFKEVVYGNIFG